jgi:predicted DNA-binding protein
MKLDKAPPKKAKPDKPASFRLSTDAIKKLGALALVLNRSKAEILEHLIEEAFEGNKKKYPDEISRALKKP